MKDAHTLVVTDDLRRSADRLRDRLGPVQTIAHRDWTSFTGQLGFESTGDTQGASVLVGPPAFVLKHATVAAQGFGFVMPVAQTSRLWQRAANWRDDATLGLWRAGWAPRALDRILVPTHHAVLEFAIGDVRPIPAVATASGDPVGA